jgi:hypothetical protein
MALFHTNAGPQAEPNIKELLDKGQCSFPATKKKYHDQFWYHCRTCFTESQEVGSYSEFYKTNTYYLRDAVRYADLSVTQAMMWWRHPTSAVSSVTAAPEATKALLINGARLLNPQLPP